MLLYSLMHWLSLRDNMFLQYATMLAGNMVFMLAYFGIGPQYLWPDLPELSQRVAPLAVLMAVAAASFFINSALALKGAHERMFWLLRGGAALALLTLGQRCSAGSTTGWRSRWPCCSAWARC